VIEPSTGVLVTLVGTMHYNPTSISLARRTVEEACERQTLSSVIVESFPSRWNNKVSPLISWLIPNEMRAATDAASQQEGVSVVLGDQAIEETNKRLKESLKQTLLDLANPLGLGTDNGGGVKALYAEVSEALRESSNEGKSEEERLTSADFLDPRLLLSAPISLVRYPLSIVVKAPKVGIPILLAIALTSSFDSGAHAFAMALTGGSPSLDLLAASASIPSSSSGLLDWLLQQTSETITSAAIAALELAVLSRPFLVVLLSERNKVITDNILQQCKLAVEIDKKKNNKEKGWNIFKNKEKEGSKPPREIVVVLGMAHINGVRSRLESNNYE